jgi:hypothetical protein
MDLLIGPNAGRELFHLCYVASPHCQMLLVPGLSSYLHRKMLVLHSLTLAWRYQIFVTEAPDPIKHPTRLARQDIVIRDLFPAVHHMHGQIFTMDPCFIFPSSLSLYSRPKLRNHDRPRCRAWVRKGAESTCTMLRRKSFPTYTNRRGIPRRQRWESSFLACYC